MFLILGKLTTSTEELNDSTKKVDHLEVKNEAIKSRIEQLQRAYEVRHYVCTRKMEVFLLL